MIDIRSSTAAAPSQAFVEAPRQKREDNLSWLRRNLGSTSDDGAYLLLVGGVDAASFRLRVAQSHLRHDLTPSHWSHVALFTEVNGDLARTSLLEISLAPARGFGFPPPGNGVQEGELGAYRKRKEYPNLAVVHIPINREELGGALRRFREQRAVLDATELILLWLAFTWGVGQTGNPLLTGNGIPSAAMIEVLMGALGYDLTPGLESRASSPEAIWQSARWWYEYYGAQQKQVPTGFYHMEHYLV